MRRNRQRTDFDAEIKTSSTGDIAFLLIIFFMVTATFAVTKGLEFDLPEPGKDDGPEPDPAVLVEIAPDGSILVDCKPMAADRILDYLSPRLLRNPRKPVILYAHAVAEYRHMIRVYDVMVRAPERGLPVPSISIPTPADIERYTTIFGVNPFESHCHG